MADSNENTLNNENLMTRLLNQSSRLSTNTNFIKNDDKTYKTVFNANLKVSSNDHGKMITCSAENGLSNQKWENRRILNVLCKLNWICLNLFL